MAPVEELTRVQGPSPSPAELTARHGEAVAAARRLWRERAAQVTPWLPVAAVRDLSRWARPQMEAYRRVPPLADVELDPVGVDPAGRVLVLEGTVDTLPSHHPLVTRWLKVFVRYDLAAGQIDHVTVTIRGQVEE